jgi:two-component system sensor histidine kinase KdpD
MIVFLVVAILTSSMVSAIQTNLRKVSQKEREAVQLSQLSTALSGKIDQVEIAGLLKTHLENLLYPYTVDLIMIENPGTIKEIETSLLKEDNGRLLLRQPMISNRVKIGDILVYGNTTPINPGEERLVQIVASQGAIALERARLAEIEAGSRVLRESNLLKTAILSSLSHELRTPLASIQASATTLFNKKVKLNFNARKELEDLLLEETERMIQLIGNLLNMSRMEAGELKLQRQWNSLYEIVDTCLKRTSTVNKDKAIKVNVSEELPLVSVDAVLMEQVLTNLISNSLRFAPTGSSIYVNADADESRMNISVSNTGPHIPESHLPLVFDKFHVIPGQESAQGTGLGLSICKGIVEAHGGTISARNLEIGVSFEITLPLSWNGVMPAIPEKEAL